MRRSKLRPRPDQVAELTRGAVLPLPPLPHATLLVIAETLERAWNELAVEHGETLCSGDEAEVSALLVLRLNQLLDEESCWATVAVGVSRGREVISFDGRRLEMRPDISIHLARRNFDYPLVLECKLIDHPRAKTTGLYCSQGLIRFIQGDYAWMSREAFMLAYVRDGSRVATDLRLQLAKAQKVMPDPYATDVLPRAIPHRPAYLAQSHHRRNFVYHSPAQHKDPGSLDIWHLWLSITP